MRIWGGSSWKQQQQFAHPLVKLIDFSPCEQYLVTWSNEPIVVHEGAKQGPQYLSPDDEGNNMAVWDIKSGHLLRTFSTLVDGETPTNKKQIHWPALKWSPDDKFVARLTRGQMISVYEVPGMHLHGKKSLKIEGVLDFEWCPLGDKDKEDVKVGEAPGKSKKARENMLAYWTPEMENQPARVTLIAFPSRTILRQKNLFNVTEVGPCLPRVIDPTCSFLYSVNFTGKTRVTSSALKSTGTQRRKSLYSATSRSSECAKRTTQSKSSN